MTAGIRAGHRPHRRWSSDQLADIPINMFRPSRHSIDLLILTFLLCVCALGGGTAFADVPSLLYVRPVAVLCLVAFSLTPGRIDRNVFKAPITFLTLLAALMVIQLVPLPPVIWTALPGRAVYKIIGETAGIEQPWRPISLTPDLTMNSLVSLVVPAAVLVGFAKLRRGQQRQLVLVLVALCAASALLGIVQISGGRDSSFYLYQRTYEGYAVGLLSNRNHQATLLALAFPALRVWTILPGRQPDWLQIRQWAALGVAVVLVPVVLASGSRAGMVLTLLSIVATLLLFPVPLPDWHASVRDRSVYLVRIAALATIGIFAFIAYWFGRAASIERLLTTPVAGSDQRLEFAPYVLDIIKRTFPIGTGFGSFDPVFRQYEPDGILVSTIFNHAHNELLELALMAGALGLSLLIAFLIWWGKCMICSWHFGDRSFVERSLVRFGGITTGILLLASLVDYPLRPPLMSAVFILGCCWLATPAGSTK